MKLLVQKGTIFYLDNSFQQEVNLFTKEVTTLLKQYKKTKKDFNHRLLPNDFKGLTSNIIGKRRE